MIKMNIDLSTGVTVLESPFILQRLPKFKELVDNDSIGNILGSGKKETLLQYATGGLSEQIFLVNI